MTKICLVRHGETDWNKEKRLQGRTDIQLNQTGELQANKVGEYLKNYKWDKVISSPLKRAKKTADIIGSIVGIDSVATDERLVERHYGLAEGMSFEERTIKYPNNQYDGQEDWHDLRGRMYSTILEYAKENNGLNIMIVSHGSAINSLLHTLSNGEYGSGITKLHNVCINMINFDNDVLEVESYNLKTY